MTLQTVRASYHNCRLFTQAGSLQDPPVLPHPTPFQCRIISDLSCQMKPPRRPSTSPTSARPPVAALPRNRRVSVASLSRRCDPPVTQPARRRVFATASPLRLPRKTRRRCELRRCDLSRRDLTPRPSASAPAAQRCSGIRPASRTPLPHRYSPWAHARQSHRRSAPRRSSAGNRAPASLRSGSWQ